MTLFRNASELLPGLQPAAFRGVRFDVVDVSHEVGRRIVTHFFPGVDAQAREDQGAHDGEIRAVGFVIGDDYIARGRALEAALRAPGPGTLVHPWLGEIRAVVPSGAKLRFQAIELRVMRFEISFEREVAQLTGGLATLPRLLGGLGSIRAAAGALIAAALGRQSGTVIALAAAVGVATDTLRIASREAERARNGAALAGGISSTQRRLARQASAEALAGLPSQLGEAIAQAARPRRRSAVAPGPRPADRPEPIPPRDGARMGLRVLDPVGDLRATMLADRATRAALHAAIATGAVAAASAIDYESREEALRQRDALDAALRVSAALASDLATDLPGPASRLWRAIGDARSALTIDINEIIGRLPRTRRVVAPGVPVMLLAYDLAGDDPRSVFDQAVEITRRNRLANPAFTPTEGVEVLR
ncbi:MAG: hypothetical protein EA385_17455 [Salinarimonadaceae bacterium]|nr:MAG: hypothetical protein EA385_17455 [Salinarimonadaceae bacterium]